MSIHSHIHGYEKYGGRHSQIALDLLGPVDGFEDPLDQDQAAETATSREDRLSELQARRNRLYAEIDEVDAEITKIYRERRR